MGAGLGLEVVLGLDLVLTAGLELGLISSGGWSRVNFEDEAMVDALGSDLGFALRVVEFEADVEELERVVTILAT